MTKLPPLVKFIIDTIPLLCFFIGYKYYGLTIATFAIVLLTPVSVLILYVFERKIAIAPLITAVVVAFFGGLTIYLHDETYIKIKPTLVNLVFAAILMIGCLKKQGFLKHVFGAAFNLTSEGWYLLSLRWSFFFLGLAVLNEIIWRNFPTDIWVNFKVFGLMGLTILFTFSQMGLIKKYASVEPCD